MSRRILTMVIAAIAIAAASPAGALATGPNLEPRAIRAEGFESATLPIAGVTAEYVDSTGVNANAWWGPVTNRKASGSYGLWCAGSRRTGSPVTVASLYATATAGMATVELSELEHYYSSTAGFRYTMPTLGSGDSLAFSVRWFDQASPGTRQIKQPFGLTALNSFAERSYSLSDPLNDKVVLSRRPGGFTFRFIDDLEGYGGGGGVGEGATVDDLAVSAFMYGPVRTASASVIGDDVRLTWSPPASSTVDAANDTRPMVFRVWRAQQGSSVWTELTDRAGVAATTFDDGSAVAGVPYKYSVQAWSVPPAADDWGEPGEEALATVGEPSVKVTPTLSLSSTSLSPSYGAYFTLNASFRDDGGVLVSGKEVDLQSSTNAVDWHSHGPRAFTGGTYSLPQKRYTTIYFRFVFAGDSLYGPAVSPTVMVKPRVYLTRPRGPSTARRRRTYTWYGYLKPRHRAGGYSVKLYFYRYQSGRWVLRKTAKARNYDYSSYTKYRARTYLPYTGSWKVKAYHRYDSKNASTSSSYKSFRVR